MEKNLEAGLLLSKKIRELTEINADLLEALKTVLNLTKEQWIKDVLEKAIKKAEG